MPSSYTLGSHFEALLKKLVQSGRYNNASEVIREGLRLVEERECRLAGLDAAITRGLADADAGRRHDIEIVRAALGRQESRN